MARAIWKGSISFGLINIPVQLMGATEEQSIHFTMLDSKDRSKISYKKVNSTTGREVDYKKIVKGYEYKKGKYVLVTDEDFKAANPKSTQTIDIEDFIELNEIDFMFFDKSYYLTPQKNAEKVYALLMSRLEKLKKVAVGKIVIRTKQHLCAIISRDGFLILEILRFAHEVLETHEADYLEDMKTHKFSSKETSMADALIEKMSSQWKPEKYKDTYQDDLMKLIKQKIKKGEDFEPEYEDVEVEPTSNVVDLLPLLEKSLGLSSKAAGRSAKKAIKRRAKTSPSATAKKKKSAASR